MGLYICQRIQINGLPITDLMIRMALFDKYCGKNLCKLTVIPLRTALYYNHKIDNIIVISSFESKIQYDYLYN